MKEKDGEKKAFLAVIHLIKVMLKEGHGTKSYLRLWLGDCYKNLEIQFLLSNTDIVTLKDLRGCIFNIIAST